MLIIILLMLVLLLLLHLLRRLEEAQQQNEQVHTELDEKIERERDNLFAQLEAYNSLRDRLDLRKGMPFTKSWSAAPDFLQLIVNHALAEKPQVIFECSSGLTSLMLARCCQLNGAGHLFSLENGEEYAAKSRAEIDRYELTDFADVVYAPLEGTEVNGDLYQWYAQDGIPDAAIDMLVIDGPPGFIQRYSRFPALPLLYDKLADGCVIYMDDAAREDELEIIEMWKRLYPKLEHRYLKTERGCSVVVIRK
ncbi:hypothetical protein BOW53_01995 [Solemya pervernicosa gill symbiont]|uniref:Methyltransferase n=1 Tax=Solemya pervernicosa gill symbiont TaxID=642797 RepID=A0A1T2LA47_9GAMM|nr:hypothetical protein BOW53_01995 [Solemya pervernicosa gill symbiont]